jgi:hypothetical protein
MALKLEVKPGVSTTGTGMPLFPCGAMHRANEVWEAVRRTAKASARMDVPSFRRILCFAADSGCWGFL